jgi:hypothetical protein
MESQSELKLSRFCGDELYPITTATWEVFEDGDEPCELWLEIEAGRGTQLHDDTSELDAEPHWELTFVSDSLRPDNPKGQLTRLFSPIPRHYGIVPFVT